MTCFHGPRECTECIYEKYYLLTPGVTLQPPPPFFPMQEDDWIEMAASPNAIDATSVADNLTLSVHELREVLLGEESDLYKVYHGQTKLVSKRRKVRDPWRLSARWVSPSPQARLATHFLSELVHLTLFRQRILDLLGDDAVIRNGCFPHPDAEGLDGEQFAQRFAGLPGRDSRDQKGNVLKFIKVKPSSHSVTHLLEKIIRRFCSGQGFAASLASAAAFDFDSDLLCRTGMPSYPNQKKKKRKLHLER
jgi:hypothetical protein